MKSLLFAAIAAIILAGSLAGGIAEDMNTLGVSLGFDQFPKEYTCDGRNVSPQIEISGLNATSNLTALAMILEDPDAPIGTFTHWVIWNIPPANVIPSDIPKVMNVTEPVKAVQGANGAGTIGYIGPCPPAGKPHRYFLQVYGLDKMLDLEPGSNVSDLRDAMNGSIVLQGEAMATYGR